MGIIPFMRPLSAALRLFALADEWQPLHCGGLSCSQPVDHGKKGAVKRSPVAVTKPRTSHSRIIAYIPRLRWDCSCCIIVAGGGGWKVAVMLIIRCLEGSSGLFCTGSGGDV